MLIFDFDGVLMDSVREIAVTAYNMINDTIITRLDQMPQNALNLFLRNRFHVQPIGDAPVLMKWCLETGASDPDKLLSPAEYDEILARVDEPVAARTTRFFETRNRFKTMNINAWTALNAPVQPLWRIMIENSTESIVLLTNKNREATIALSSHFGLSISDENIYSGDNGTTKIENMTHIMQRFRKPTYAFIDDSVKNLREIDEHFNKEEKTISLIFATWGYTGPDDARSAGNFGYQVLTIDEFTEKLPAMLT
ncbi:MAG: HAD family hydrolase [Desulfobacterales bacterium]|jgi:FMN phosphatase YigB (HAD superfamily)